MRKVSPQEKQEALDRLREWMPAGSTVYCVLRKRRRSGMQREIGLVVVARKDRDVCALCCMPRYHAWHAPAETCEGCQNPGEHHGHQPTYGPTFDLRHPNHAAGVVLGLRVNEAKSGLVVRGCGMDMGWHLVHRLSSALYGRDNALRAEWI